MTTQIKVHIDTLKFTRDGLDTKEPIELTVGSTTRSSWFDRLG